MEQIVEEIKELRENGMPNVYIYIGIKYSDIFSRMSGKELDEVVDKSCGSESLVTELRKGISLGKKGVRI